MSSSKKMPTRHLKKPFVPKMADIHEGVILDFPYLIDLEEYIDEGEEEKNVEQATDEQKPEQKEENKESCVRTQESPPYIGQPPHASVPPYIGPPPPASVPSYTRRPPPSYESHERRRLPGFEADTRPPPPDYETACKELNASRYAVSNVLHVTDELHATGIYDLTFGLHATGRNYLTVTGRYSTSDILHVKGRLDSNNSYCGIKEEGKINFNLFGVEGPSTPKRRLVNYKKDSVKRLTESALLDLDQQGAWGGDWGLPSTSTSEKEDFEPHYYEDL